MHGEEWIGWIRAAIEWAALGIEMLGALVIVAGVLRVAITRGTVRFLVKLDDTAAYENYKHQIGRSLLLGLEFLVAADIIRTVAIAPSFTNLGLLAVIVLIRTFLSWSLELEIEGHWPWQARREPRQSPEASAEQV